MACILDGLLSVIGSDEKLKFLLGNKEFVDAISSIKTDDKSRPYYEKDAKVNQSGGAIGTDGLYGNVASAHDIKSNHFYRETSKNPPRDGNVAITDAEYAQGIVMVAKAAKLLGRKVIDKFLPLWARNWVQVKNADGVYAIAEIDGTYVDGETYKAFKPKSDNGKVTIEGGTGWAVAMAEIEYINDGRPIYVFVPSRDQWFRKNFESGDYVLVDGIPKLEGNFAGIGTRDIESKFIEKGKYTDVVPSETTAAVKAVIDLFEEAYGTTNVNIPLFVNKAPIDGFVSIKGTTVGVIKGIPNNIKPFGEKLDAFKSKIDKVVSGEITNKAVSDFMTKLANSSNIITLNSNFDYHYAQYLIEKSKEINTKASNTPEVANGEVIYKQDSKNGSEYSEIYSKLGKTTKNEFVQIVNMHNEAGAESAASKNAVFALRVPSYKFHFGNPFSSIGSLVKKYKLTKTSSTRESVEKYIDWVLNSNEERAIWIRNQLISGELKGKKIWYYKELGEPSHATALSYLINNYDFGSKETQTTQSVPTETFTKGNLLQWHSGAKTVTTINGATTFKVDDVDTLIELSNEYDQLINANGAIETVKGVDATTMSTDSSSKGTLNGMLKDMLNFNFIPITVKFNKTSVDSPSSKAVTPGRFNYVTSTMELTGNTKGSKGFHNPSPLYIVGHEYGHTITAKVLDENPTLKARVTKLMEFAKTKVPGVQDKVTTARAFDDEAEFMAEVLINEELQKELASFKYGEGVTLLDAIKKIFKTIYSLVKTDGTTGLDYALSIVYDINTNSNNDVVNTSISTNSSPTINVWSRDKNGYEKLSNFAARKFTYKGKEYNSVEHAYQVWKSGTEDLVTDGKYRRSGQTDKIGGGKPVNKDTSSILMKELMKLSFEQNEAAKNLLLSTNNSVIVHNGGTDKYWEKEFPRLLMEVRDGLKSGTTASIPEVVTKPIVHSVDARGLNEDQAVAFDNIVKFFMNPDTRVHVLDAAGGTGNNIVNYEATMAADGTFATKDDIYYSKEASTGNKSDTKEVLKSKFTKLKNTTREVYRSLKDNNGVYVPTNAQIFNAVDIEFRTSLERMAFNGTPDAELESYFYYYKDLDIATLSSEERMALAKGEIEDLNKEHKDSLIQIFGKASIDFMALDANDFYNRYWNEVGPHSSTVDGLGDMILSGNYVGRGDYKKLLEHIIKSSEDEVAVEYAKAVLNIANAFKGNENLKISRHLDTFPGTKGAAYYDPNSNVISYVNPTHLDNPFTLIHEIVHGLSINAVNNMEFAIQMFPESNDAKIYADLFKDIDFILNDVKHTTNYVNISGIGEMYDRDAGGSFYGFTNRYEFLSEFMSNKFFREFLKNVYPNGTKVNIYNKIRLALAKLFGLSSGKVASMFDIIDSKIHVVFALNKSNTGEVLDKASGRAMAKALTKEDGSIITPKERAEKDLEEIKLKCGI